MKKTLLAIIALVLLGACNTKTDYNQVKQGIIEQERGRLPLVLQTFDEVSNITIDSMVILNNVNPHYGYLVTEWEFQKHSWSMPESKTVYVQIDSLMIDKKQYSWQINWAMAYFSAVY